jgi:uncharacterized membrane protein YidH (DUF202 family)
MGIIFFPNIAYASLGSFVANLNRLIINPLIVLLFALAVAYFLYGLVEFLSNQDNEEKKTSSKSHMLYGVIGMAIMMGAFMIMDVILNTLNIPKSQIDPNTGSVKLKDYTPKWP